MARRWLLRALGVLAIVGALLAGAHGADEPRFQIIVHPDNPVTEVDTAFLRAAYLKKRLTWSHGPGLQPLDLSARFPIRATFTSRVLRKTGHQLRAYWNQQIFSGKGTPPPQVDTVHDAVDFVLARRGAIAYLPAGADPGRAKVIPLR